MSEKQFATTFDFEYYWSRFKNCSLIFE